MKYGQCWTGSPPDWRRSVAQSGPRRRAGLSRSGPRRSESGSLHEQIEADMQFHAFINELSGNPLIGETTAPHWPYLRRVMGEVLRDDAQMPQTILSEHVAILDADDRGRWRSERKR